MLVAAPNPFAFFVHTRVCVCEEVNTPVNLILQRVAASMLLYNTCIVNPPFSLRLAGTLPEEMSRKSYHHLNYIQD